MKKIINGKMYNTETAEEIGSWENTPYKSNYIYFKEYLYRKRTGEFFLYGSGNAASKYCEETTNRMRSPGERIVPLTIKEAMVWVENYCDADTYIELFGEVEE
jgi:hypothetical protein